MPKPSITRKSGRHFLTDRIRGEVDWWGTPQALDVEPPPVQKPVPKDATVIALPGRELWQLPSIDLASAIAGRESHRRYLAEPLSLAELAFLLWMSQGVRRVVNEAAVLRSVPSAGCRHPLETYLAVFRVTGLSPGIYRYLPLDHALVFVSAPEGLAAKVTAACRGQRFAGQAAAVFFWTAVPSRTEWRYAEASYKVIALDAGHVCQNLYLACAAVAAGTCAIAAYDQELADRLLEVDGDEEFTLYIAPVGKV